MRVINAPNGVNSIHGQIICGSPPSISDAKSKVVSHKSWALFPTPKTISLGYKRALHHRCYTNTMPRVYTILFSFNYNNCAYYSNIFYFYRGETCSKNISNHELELSIILSIFEGKEDFFISR